MVVSDGLTGVSILMGNIYFNVHLKKYIASTCNFIDIIAQNMSKLKKFDFMFIFFLN